jgi:serine/threonine protein kinase
MPAANELLQEGRYLITQQSAQFNSGAVYDAYDTVRDTSVVVKEIIVQMNKVMTPSQQESLKATFASQARILSTINHDSLLHVHDYFSDIGRQYLVMEPAAGDNLETLLKNNGGPFRSGDVLNWADQMLDALDYLHIFTPPVVHKNIQPCNILLRSGGRIKLLAFGVGDSSETVLSTDLSSNTVPKLNYMPLEQLWENLDQASQKVITNSYDEYSERILKEPLDARSDIYALGATLYCLLTGIEPIDALERSIEVLDGKADPLKSAHRVNPAVPYEISDCLIKAMEIKRENRFDSAQAMRQALKTAAASSQEREDEEALEQEEAKQTIKLAGHLRNEQVRQYIEEKERELEAAKERQARELEQKLREAEQQRLEAEQLRLEAERRAAEAERLLREKEELAAKKAEAKSGASEVDDLLEICAPPSVEPQTAVLLESESVLDPDPDTLVRRSFEEPDTEEPVLGQTEVAFDQESSDRTEEEDTVEMAGSQTAIIAEEEMGHEVETLADEAELACSGEIEQDLAAPEGEDAQIEESNTVEPDSAIHVDGYDEPIEVETVYSEASAADEIAEEDPVSESTYAAKHMSYEPVGHNDPVFSYVEPQTRSGLPIPVIGGAAALVLAIVVGGWFMLSTGSGDPSASNPSAAVTSQPATTAPAQSAIPTQPAPENTYQAPEDQLSAEQAPADQALVSGDDPAANKQSTPAETPKPKKVETAKAPANKKKAVTVDDLINDN